MNLGQLTLGGSGKQTGTLGPCSYGLIDYKQQDQILVQYDLRIMSYIAVFHERVFEPVVFPIFIRGVVKNNTSRAYRVRSLCNSRESTLFIVTELI